MELNLLIKWFFNLCVDVWTLISQYWVLSIFFFIGIMDFIISMFNNSSSN